MFIIGTLIYEREERRGRGRVLKQPLSLNVRKRERVRVISLKERA